MSPTLLLVTGAGRSGTSTMAGALAHLGVHVPGPYLAANRTNPRGFYESKWSVDFHNRLLQRAAVGIADGRPEAASLMHAAVRAPDRERLRGWLTQATEGHDLTVVKDPRICWEIPLWSEVAEDLGLRPAYVVMLRHAAEVVGSRATHYADRNRDVDATTFAVKNLAGWVNAMLVAERFTRERSRTFVRYDDLLADWRSTLAAVDSAFGLRLPLGDAQAAGRVEEFLDPDLRRHRIGFGDLTEEDLPLELREVAESVWSACTSAETPDASDLDSVAGRYAGLYGSARRLAFDHTAAEVSVARRQARRAARKKIDAASRTPPTLADRLRRVVRRWV
ncbi:MAG TPA: sulfotransferase family protein [Nocardioidaceae bacterium]|nr:sulfotransferase family protein [Nocardioidaceae bacterium]